MADRPLTAADILAGRSPFGRQEVKPDEDPRWSTKLAHLAEQGVSGLGASPAVTAKAGDIGNTVGGTLGSMSLHDAIPNLVEGYRYLTNGRPLQAAGSVLAAMPMVPGAGAVERTAADAIERAGARAMTEVPSLRGVPVEQAIETARPEPHLIPANEGSRSGFVGGPPDVLTAEDLAARRHDFDQYVAADPRGYDWYDRYRAGMTRFPFRGPAPPMTVKSRNAINDAIATAKPADAGEHMPARIDSNAVSPEWGEPGSGSVTRGMLSAMDENPGLWDFFNQNADIGRVAGGQAQRDVAWAPELGEQRPDIFNMRMVAADESQPGGWADKLKAALQSGVPATAVVGGATVPLFPSAGLAATPGQGPQYDDWWRQLQEQRFAGQ